MAFWVYAAFWFATLVLGELLRPKPENQAPKPAGLGDFQFPTATEGRPVPVNWGHNEIKGANLVWYGDYKAEAIKEKVKTGMFSSDKVTVGYKYYVGLHFVLCHRGLGSITKIKFGEKTAWEGDAMNTTVHVNKKGLFGGEDSEGGIAGYFAFQDGNLTQTADPYLVQELGATECPAYRGVSSVIFYGPSGSNIGGGATTGYVGTTTYLKNPAFQVKRYPTVLGSTYEQVGDDANPVECLYELLTNREWGAGLSTGHFDTASWIAAAQTLHTEGHGFSMLWDRRTSIRQIASEILQQIDGLIYTDPATGKLTLKLARNDYDAGTLPVYDTSNVIELESFVRGAWNHAISEVTMAYHDSAQDFKQKAVAAHNAAVWDVDQDISSHEIKYPGVRKAQLAADLATREMRAASYTPAKLTIRTTREAHDAYPGMPFKFTWPEIGVTEVIMRVQNISLGDAVDGTIKIDAIQDLFALATASFTAPQPSGWVPPIGNPVAIQSQWLDEAPYWMNLTAGRANPGTGNYVSFQAVQPSSDTLGYALQLKESADTDYSPRQKIIDFSPLGELSVDFPRYEADGTGTLTMTNVDNLGALEAATWGEIQAGNNLAQIDDEIIAFEGITDLGGGTWRLDNVHRGLLDTVPADHLVVGETHQHWRVYIETNNGNTSYTGISFIGFYDANDVLLSTGGTATASSNTSGYAPWEAFDTRIQVGYWWLTASGQEAPCWLAYDFGAAVTPAYIKMHPDPTETNTYYNRNPKQFRIQYSDNGVDWFDLPGASYDIDTWDTQVWQTLALGSDRKVHFLDFGLDSTEDEWTVNDTVQARGITYNANGEIDPANAPIAEHVIVGRANAPYPPGDFTINGTRYLLEVSNDNDMTVAWHHRDRITQGAAIVSDSDNTDYGPEAGTTYDLAIYDAETNLLKHTYAGLTGTSQVLDELNDFPRVLGLQWGDYDETLGTLSGNDNGSYLDAVNHEIYIDPTGCSTCGMNCEMGELPAGEEMGIRFKRTQAGTWFDDDHTDSATYIYFFPDPTANGSPVYLSSTWTYKIAQGAGPFVRISMRHDEAQDLTWRSMNSAEQWQESETVLLAAASRGAGQFNGTDTQELRFYRGTGDKVAIEYKINGVSQATALTTIDWPTTDTQVVLHHHRYNSTASSELFSDMEWTGGIIPGRWRKLRLELSADRSGTPAMQKIVHEVQRDTFINATSAAITIAGSTATITKLKTVTAGNGAQVIAASNATVTKV